MTLYWKIFFNISSIYCKLDCGYILAVFTTIFKFQMIHPVILKVHSFSLFLLPKMVLTNRIRLVLQHLHESFFWSRPHLKDTRWSTRWSKILWRSPRQTWRSWGERAKARMRTSTRTRKVRWDELKKTKTKKKTTPTDTWHIVHTCTFFDTRGRVHITSLIHKPWHLKLAARVAKVTGNMWSVWSVQLCRSSLFVWGFWLLLSSSRIHPQKVPLHHLVLPAYPLIKVAKHVHKQESKQALTLQAIEVTFD